MNNAFSTLIAKLNKITLIIIFILLFTTVNSRSFSIIKDAEIENLLYDYTHDLIEIGLNNRTSNIYIVSDPSINAFVVPNGDIYINVGLLYHADTPNEVTSIIAHEIGHVINNHHITRSIELDTLRKKQSISQILGIGVGMTGMMNESDTLSNLGPSISLSGSGIAIRDYLKYSRTQEYDADMMAIKLMDSIGQSSIGLISILEKINNQMQIDRTDINPLDMTHAFPSDRINLIREKIYSQKSSSIRDSKDLISRHNFMRAKIIGYMNLPNVFDSNSIYFKYQKSIRLYKNGKLDDALLILNDLNDKIESIYFTELIAQIYFEKKQYNIALEYINRAIAKDENESQFSILKAMILLEMDGMENIEESINILNSHVSDSNQNAQIYWHLSQAYFKIENIGMADLNIAKYYTITNQNDRAINFAERAKNNLTIYSNEWIQADDISKTMN
ncbi:MAG: hypothetical protein EBZ28_05265 [Alphaproteobacteria bacterium]|nr:hypothetical protein [Alphaproteobacteria bacterium]